MKNDLFPWWLKLAYAVVGVAVVALFVSGVLRWIVLMWGW